MRTFLLAAVAAFALSSPGLAADLPVKAPVAKLFTWTGCYVGGQVGYKSASSDPTWQNEGTPTFPDGLRITDTLHPNGAIGGLTVGCNYQFAPNWVAGIEGDYSWADLHSDANLLPPGNPSHTFEVKEHSFATARARLGYAADHWLLFVSGGAAWARVEAIDTSIPSGGTLYESVTQTYTGWTVGGGLEYALTNNWLVKAEYLYADLGTKRSSLVNSLGAEADVSLKQHVVRAGVNYKF
jgi:outer membrane immunogenic protein